MLKWWREWRVFKSLPYDGGFGDQPCYVAEAIELCEQEAIRYEGEMHDREMKRAKAAASG